jgi:predicted AAA+ superfamily ATPase
MINKLFELSERAISLADTHFIRPYISALLSDDRLIGIKGSRGVGKTTLLLQYAKLYLNDHKRLYISLDNPYLAGLKLHDLADDFVKNGGEVLLLDEVHHYPNWSLVLKFIYDNYKDLKVIYTGSSLLHLSKGQSDLSRRTNLHLLPGLSLREFINLTEAKDFKVLSLEQIISDHASIASAMLSSIKPIQKYNEYLQIGFYPFFIENREAYPLKLLEIINQILEIDLPLMVQINYSNVRKIKLLLSIIAQSVPFKPNFEKLSAQIGVSKNTLKAYIQYLDDALLINTLISERKTDSVLSKPDKIYLGNTNFMYGLVGSNMNSGTLRETFFMNQVQVKYRLHYPEVGDFMVDRKFLFEIGGKGKTFKQIAGIENSFIAADDIEIGYKNTIPLWLFGFLY